MGQMKEFLAGLGHDFHAGNYDKIREMMALEDDHTWTLSQLCALRTMYDGETDMFTVGDEPELADGFFIGGEGSPEIEFAICFDCFWHMKDLMQWRPDRDIGWLRVQSEFVGDWNYFHRYDNFHGFALYEPKQCGCGNFIFTAIGHDALFSAVASKQMSPQIAVAYVNRLLSYEHDPRAYLAENAGLTKEEWDD